MENKIQSEEMLYRAIKRSKPNWLDKGYATSSMFKDAKGNSVDRDDKRSIEQVIQFMQEVTFKNRLKGVVELNAGKCMEIGIKLEAAPSEINPYHANILIDEDEKKGALQALMLADISRVVYENKDVDWVIL